GETGGSARWLAGGDGATDCAACVVGGGGGAGWLARTDGPGLGLVATDRCSPVLAGAGGGAASGCRCGGDADPADWNQTNPPAAARPTTTALVAATAFQVNAGATLNGPVRDFGGAISIGGRPIRRVPSTTIFAASRRSAVAPSASL